MTQVTVSGNDKKELAARALKELHGMMENEKYIIKNYTSGGPEADPFADIVVSVTFRRRHPNDQ